MGSIQFSNTELHHNDLLNETVEYETRNRIDLRSLMWLCNIMWVGKFLELIWRISQRPMSFCGVKIWYFHFKWSSRAVWSDMRYLYKLKFRDLTDLRPLVCFFFELRANGTSTNSAAAQAMFSWVQEDILVERKWGSRQWVRKKDGISKTRWFIALCS